MVGSGYRLAFPEGRYFHFELPSSRGEERKSGLKAAKLAKLNENAVSAPSLAKEIVD